MARTIKVVVVRNTLRQEGRRIGRNLEKRVPQVARDMRNDLAEAMASGGLPLQPDTTALANSFAVQSAEGSDFAEQRQAAKSAYLNNASKYKEAVQAEVSRSAYTEEHFENRAAVDEPPLSQGQHVARAAILTMLAWGILWEYGHYNLFTRKTEHRPFFVPYLEEWWKQNAKQAFSGLAN